MKEGKTKQIDELVDQVLRNMGLEQKFKEHEVCMSGPEVVGHDCFPDEKCPGDGWQALRLFHFCRREK